MLQYVYFTDWIRFICDSKHKSSVYPVLSVISESKKYIVITVESEYNLSTYVLGLQHIHNGGSYLVYQDLKFFFRYKDVVDKEKQPSILKLIVTGHVTQTIFLITVLKI